MVDRRNTRHKIQLGPGQGETMRILHTFALCTAAVAVIGAASKAGVKDGYASPTVVVPYAVVKPVIDGKIDDNEWRGAVIR